MTTTNPSPTPGVGAPVEPTQVPSQAAGSASVGELGPNGQALVDEITAPSPFGDQDRAILEFERLRFLSSAGKEAEILSRFAMTAVRYYVRLNWILGQPEAREYDAQGVTRLLDLAAKRRDVRTRGTVAAGVPTRADGRGIRPALLGSDL